MDPIGRTAGDVWRYLNNNGEMTTAKLIRGLNQPRDLVQRAIGWLAREDKVHLEKAKRGERIRLV